MRTISPDDVLHHMEVPGERNLFVVGCFEKRVTLYSQQVRALNLVYSLRSAGRLPEGARVAVVGAGAAGMTAAAALARLGCEVTLLEKKGSLLPLQRGNTTRYLHPHLYDWPMEGSEREDAGLPLLNWRATFAGEVVRQLEQQWEALPERSRINWAPHVKSIVLGQGTPRAVSWNAPGFESNDFDVVILTVGFGLERRVEGIQWKSYWDSDSLHQSSRSDQTEHHLISGCGDGGLVDLLRVRLQDFRHDTIVQRFLNSPTLTTVRTKLLEIEEQAWRESNPNKYLFNEYKRLQVPTEVDTAIEKALRQDTSAVLNGLELFPLTLHSSILNRFLVSRLIFRFGVPYRSGSISPVRVGERYEVQFSAGRPELFDQITCRHGPGQSVLEAEFQDTWAKCAPLRARNELDQTRWPIWPPGFFSPKPQSGGTGGSAPGRAEEPLAKPPPPVEKAHSQQASPVAVQTFASPRLDASRTPLRSKQVAPQPSPPQAQPAQAKPPRSILAWVPPLALILLLGASGFFIITRPDKPPTVESPRPGAHRENLPPEEKTAAVQPTPVEEEDPTALAAHLQKLDASADGFTVLFPGQPTAERQKVATPSGELQTVTWAMKIEGVYYSINITDNPEKNIKATSSQKFLDAVRTQLVGQLKGNLESEEQLTLQGFPGRTYTVSSPNGQMKARNYLVGNRLYTLFVISPDGKAPGDDQFLNSLQLVNPPLAPEVAIPKSTTE